MGNYTKYHLHDEYSNANGYFDSSTNFQDYIDLAKKEGDHAIAFSNHGGIYDWIKKKMACDKAKIKYIHGVETYMCRELEFKESFHIGLYSKNYDGVLELNKLLEKASSKHDGHFYRNQRVSLEEIMNTSENIIVTTACIASLLSKLPNDEYTNRFIEWMSKNKDRCFLEIQYHKHELQVEYNKYLYNIHKKYNIPLIAGTDTHSANDYLAECRKIAQIAKDSFYGDEDSFDVTWKTYDELVQCFKEQDCIPEEDFMIAIENTNVFANMVEDFKIDRTFKYPNLYEDAKNKWKEAILKKLKYKLSIGEIDYNRIEEYKDSVIKEFKAMSKQGMESLMLFMSELCDFCIKNNIPYGDCRGSVGGSTIAYITNITDVDPLVWGTVFSRFCNEERVSLADIDMDFAPEDRSVIYNYIMERFGDSQSSFIASFGTVKTRGAIDMLAKGLKYLDLNKVKEIKDVFEEIHKEYDKIIHEEINLEEAPQEYKNVDIDYHNFYSEKVRNNKALLEMNELVERFYKLKKDNTDIFYYFDGIKGTIVSKGYHPAGMIGSPVTLNDNIGLHYRKGEKDFPISSCSMKAIDYCNFVKFDILGLKTIGIIKDVYNMIGEKWEKAYEINWNDQEVWDDMIKNKTGNFQMESSFAHGLMTEFKPSRVNDLSLINASLRPSGKSYRHRLISGEFNINPSKQIDDLLKDNRGWLIFQEDTIKFLTDICGFTGGMADTVRRAIGKKDEVALNEQLPKILEGYCNKSDKPRHIAEKEAKEFIQIISDSSEYQFGLNHSTGYSMIGYRCARFKKYYPIEFTTAYLNRASSEDDIIEGTKLAKYYNIDIESIKFGFSREAYSCDSGKKIIYKGLSSIKDIGKSSPKNLYELSQKKKYKGFLNLLSDIKESKACEKNELEILIKLDYFSNFGKSQYLLDIVEIYNNIVGSKQIKKDMLIKLGLTEEIMKRHSGKITPKLYKDFDSYAIAEELIDSLKNEDIKLIEKLKIEEDHLGYLKYINPDISDKIYYVSEFKVYKNAERPYLKLYNLSNGETEAFKITSGFAKNHFKEKSVIKIINTEKVVKKRKDESGKWVSAEGFNTHIKDWKVLSN